MQFRALDEALIDWYLASGEWRERAGGYAIQGRGAALVAAIEGDYTNVVGLPVPTLLELAPWLLPPGGRHESLVACGLCGFAGEAEMPLRMRVFQHISGPLKGSREVTGDGPSATLIARTVLAAWAWGPTRDASPAACPASHIS